MIVEFVNRVTDPAHPCFVEPAARVAVFDNDGTLWVERSMVIQLDSMTYTASGGDRDFMRPVAGRMWRAAGSGDRSALGLSRLSKPPPPATRPSSA